VNKNTAVFKHAQQMLKESQMPLLSVAVPSLTGFDVISWNGGMPEGKAKQALNGFVAALQMEAFLPYYEIESAAAE